MKRLPLLPIFRRLPVRRIAPAAVIIISVLLLMVFVIGQERANQGLKAYDVRADGFSYRMLFYEGSAALRLSDGSTALRQGSRVAGDIKLTAVSLVQDCQDVGDGFRKAFDARITGNRTSVCAKDNGYVAVLSAVGEHFLVTVSFKEDQDEAAYPQLKRIFESITIRSDK